MATNTASTNTIDGLSVVLSKSRLAIVRSKSRPAIVRSKSRLAIVRNVSVFGSKAIKLLILAIRK